MDVSLDVIFQALAVCVIPAFGWAWRLHTEVVKLKIMQDVKVKRLCEIEEKLDRVGEQVAELAGIVKTHLRAVDRK